MLKKRLSFIIVLLVLQTLFANASSTDVVTTAYWKTEFWKNLKPEFCDKNKYFKECVDYTNNGKSQNNCEMSFQKAFISCESKITPKKTIKLISESVDTGRKMSVCIANKILKENQLLKTSACRERDKWVN